MENPRIPEEEELDVKLSEFASPEARALFVRHMALRKPSLEQGIEQLRAHHDGIDRERMDRALRQFNVEFAADEMSGIPVQVVTPKEGIPDRNVHRVLINLHGGAFMWGRDAGSLLESIPIAATGACKVVTVHYRLAPEHRFPAASEDVAAVYAHLLEQYHPDSIGIFGTSAGGILTAQAIAWLHHGSLPLPGAIGTFCGTGLEMGGDSLHFPPSIVDRLSISDETDVFKILSLPYFRDASADDPLVFPLKFESWARVFPPTLSITGGRDSAASSITLAHRRLAAAGCDSRLFVFDGLWHAFLANPELPESSEAYSLISEFFMEHLR